MTQYSGGLLTKPIFREKWRVEDLLSIEDRQTVLTMLTAEQEKREDEIDKKAVQNFETL